MARRVPQSSKAKGSKAATGMPTVAHALSARYQTHCKMIQDLERTGLENVDQWTRKMLAYHRRERDRLADLAKQIKRR